MEATFDRYVAELARHLPAFAPTIFALWEHILDDPYYRDERCCTVTSNMLGVTRR
jgi:hypothetical protein